MTEFHARLPDLLLIGRDFPPALERLQAGQDAQKSAKKHRLRTKTTHRTQKSLTFQMLPVDGSELP